MIVSHFRSLHIWCLAWLLFLLIVCQMIFHFSHQHIGVFAYGSFFALLGLLVGFLVNVTFLQLLLKIRRCSLNNFSLFHRTLRGWGQPSVWRKGSEGSGSGQAVEEAPGGDHGTPGAEVEAEEVRAGPGPARVVGWWKARPGSALRYFEVRSRYNLSLWSPPEKSWCYG